MYMYEKMGAGVAAKMPAGGRRHGGTGIGGHGAPSTLRTRMVVTSDTDFIIAFSPFRNSVVIWWP